MVRKRPPHLGLFSIPPSVLWCRLLLLWCGCLRPCPSQPAQSFVMVPSTGGGGDDDDKFNETRNTVIMERTPHNDFERYFIPYMRDFEAFLCYTNYVVDKSLLIEKIMTLPQDIVVISAPPVFGKTMNVGMLQLFLGIQTKEGVRRIREQNIGYRFFKRGQYPHPTADEHRFSGRPLIRERKEFFNRHQGMYPVVYLQMIDTQYLYDFDQMLGIMARRIGEIFEDYFYLRVGYFSRIINRANSTEEMKAKALADWKRFKAIGERRDQNATTVARSLGFLVETLAKCYGHKAVLILDEMDYMVNHVKENWVYDGEPHPWDLEAKTMDFLSDFIDCTIRDNRYLAKTIIVGETQSCITELFGDLEGRMKRYDAVNNDLAEFFGFTETVSRRLMRMGNVSDELADQAMDWYDGYRFNKKSEQTVVSPWNVIRLIETKSVKNFWENNNDARLRKLMALDSVRPTIERLVRGEQIYVAWEHVRFSAKDFDRLQGIVQEKILYPSVYDTDLVLRRLCAAGYVTVAGVRYDDELKKNVTLLAAPNKEVINEFKTALDAHSRENPYTVFR